MTEGDGNGVRYTTREMFERIELRITGLETKVDDIATKVDQATGMGSVVRWIVVPVLVGFVVAAVVAFAGGV